MLMNRFCSNCCRNCLENFWNKKFEKQSFMEHLNKSEAMRGGISKWIIGETPGRTSGRISCEFSRAIHGKKSPELCKQQLLELNILKKRSEFPEKPMEKKSSRITCETARGNNKEFL